MSDCTTIRRATLLATIGIASTSIAAFPTTNGQSADKSVANGSAAFVENRGQWDSRALYLSSLNGTNLWITQEGPVFDFRKFIPAAPPMRSGKFLVPTGYFKGHVVKMSFVNSGPTMVEGAGKQKAQFNYFFGNDEARWASKVPCFSEAVAKQPYDGISVRYSIDQGAPRYDVIVRPGADPSQVGIKIDGTDGARVLPDGNLQLKTSLGDIEERGLTAYQDTPGGRTQVPCRMVMDGNTVHFDTGGYDTNKPLIIDPLVFSTFLGGSEEDLGYAVTLDSLNNVYVTGETYSPDFPITVGAYQTSYKNTRGTGFVSKLSANGSTLLDSTFLGGSGQNGDDYAQAIALDSDGNVLVAGITGSTNFPTTTHSFQTASKNPYGTAFVSKLSSDLSTLAASTFLGGSGGDAANDYIDGLALDSSNDVFVVGLTGSTDFPVATHAFDAANGNPKGTGFIAELNPALTSETYGTYLGGSGADNTYDVVYGVAVDSSDNVVVAGFTGSTDLGTTTGAYQTTNSNPQGTAFVGKLNSTLSGALFLTYLGGTGGLDYGYDYCAGVELDTSGNPVVCGYTGSSDFPTTSGVLQTSNLNSDGTSFVAKLNSTGSALVFSTYLGGSGGKNYGYDEAYGVSLDPSNNVAVTGITASINFPTTPDALQATNLNYYATGFITELSADGSSLIYSSYLGGSASYSYDYGAGLVVDSLGNNVVVTGYTGSEDFPTSVGAYQTTDGAADGTAFVTKLGLYPDVTGISVDPGSVTGGENAGGFVELSNNAGAGGITVSLSAGVSAAASVPATVVVPAGSNYAPFTVQTSAVSVSSLVTITASYQGTSQSTTLTVGLPSVAVVTVTPNAVVGGQNTTGTVFLTDPAGPSGAVVTLSTNLPALSVPLTATVQPGDDSVEFTVTTPDVSSSASYYVNASYNNTNLSAGLNVLPPSVVGITVAPTAVTGGAAANGTVTLGGAAGPSGEVVSLSSSTTEAAVPTTVMVLAGNETAQFTINTVAVSSSARATITATYSSVSQTATLTVSPAAVSGLSVATTVFLGGGSTTGTVTLAGPAGPYGDVVKLSSNSVRATVPATVEVAAGATSATFNVQTSAVSSVSVITLTATFGLSSQSCLVSVLAAPLSSVSIAPGSVVGGNNATGTLSLEAVAGPYGNVIKLASNSANAPVPATVTVPASNTSATFTIATKAVSSTNVVTVTATFWLYSQTTTFTVTPALISSLSFAPNPVVGGQTTTSTLHLSGAAGPTGDVVKLSSNSAYAAVPSSVTVPPGQSSVTFLVHTVTTSSSRTVSITATLGASTVTVPLALSP